MSTTRPLCPSEPEEDNRPRGAWLSGPEAHLRHNQAKRSGAESQRKEVIPTRTKLFGAFIAALSIMAFAALPSAAMATNVTLKEGKTAVPVGTTLRVHSTNTVFTELPSNRTVACARVSIRGQVRTNPGARFTFREGVAFQNPEGGDTCKGSTGLEVRVENVKFRDITLSKEGTAVSGRTNVRFTLRFFNRWINPNGPIFECSYAGIIKLTGEVGVDALHVESEEETRFDSEQINSGFCEPKILLAGDFRLTRRDGTTPVTTN